MTIQEIREKFVNNEIDFSSAFALIKNLPKPWHRKEWIDRRNKIIKSECEQCKSSIGEMVAQHLSHPDNFKTIRNSLFNTLFNEFLKSGNLPKPTVTKKDIKEFHKKTTKIRNACPQCKWIRIRKRLTLSPAYFCDICKIEFDQPTSIEYNEVFKTIFPNEEQVTNYLFDKMGKELLTNYKREIYSKNEEEINRKALLIGIDQHLNYMELQNVVTFCKRCAAKMDLEHKLLCWTCKTDFFDYERFECCYKCYIKEEVAKNPFKEMIRSNH